MAQSIALANKFQPILDEIYKRESLTARMDALTKPVEHGNAAAVNVFKTSLVGLGTYSRATGYPAGDVLLSPPWGFVRCCSGLFDLFVASRQDHRSVFSPHCARSTSFGSLNLSHTGMMVSSETTAVTAKGN